jgi:hypothetical protein
LTVRNWSEAPVVVDVVSRKPQRTPATKSSFIIAVQLYLPSCCKGGPFVVGYVMMVGLALVLDEDDEGGVLGVLTGDDDTTVVLDGDAS